LRFHLNKNVPVSRSQVEPLEVHYVREVRDKEVDEVEAGAEVAQQLGVTGSSEVVREQDVHVQFDWFGP
jgi:hypothetical protein